ncbi:S-layer homology domain-containing protein [Paenibacillus sp. WQ 127069]|uniref:S-layer homology domain-containing protein n=1 Tax=Paenibacillus baimaensis TaxID=2982185 RepID=A0ABT2US25_9BACL|nr:S-layer homology domain-containing protein [Paenibacillus sp. WQ 127069]MCU6797473.1 S-layer homology domain-containing protein [Paenibacillus sp. WQ 127069]
MDKRRYGTRRWLHQMLVFIVVLCMTASFVPMAGVEAAAGVKAEAVGASGQAGSTVSVAVNMEPGTTPGNDFILGYSMELSYDAQVLELVQGNSAVKDEAPSSLFSADTSVAGKIKVEATGLTDLGFLSSKQKIFTVQLKIKDNAVPGDSIVNFTSAKYTVDGTTFDTISSPTAGTVSINPLAPGTVSIVIGSANGAPGETVDVPVSVNEASKGVGSYGIEIAYDTAALEVTKITGQSGNSFDSIYDNTLGSLKAAWADQRGGDAAITAGQKMFTISFRIKDGAMTGAKALTLKGNNPEQFTVTDASAKEMTKTLQSGKVEVAFHLKAAAGDGTALLNWNSVTGATYYNLYMGTASSVYDATYKASVTQTTYNVNGLTNGTAYYFLVKAYNAGGWITDSNEASIKPNPAVPPTLTKVGIASRNATPSVAKKGDVVTLTFTASESLKELPAVTLTGQTASVTSLGGNVYKAEYSFTGNETEGLVPFTIDFASLSGNPGVRVNTTTDGSSVLFDKTAPVGTLSINSGAESTISTSVNLTITGSDGAGSNGIRMRFSNDKVDWSSWEAIAGTKAWALSPGSGAKTVSMELTDAAGNITTPAISAAITLRNTSNGGGNSSSGSSSGSSQGETITVNVENTGNGGVVSTAVIHRTTGADGRKKDELSLTPGQTDKLVEQLKAAGSSSAKIVIPDPKDEVSEVKVTLPKESTAKLADNKVNLEISTNNVRIVIPDGSLQGWKDDIYFNIVPVKTESGRSEIEQRARTEQIVREAAGSAIVNVLGRPMMIETNMQNRPVTLVLPLPDTGLNEQQLKELGIFIEHSDGTKELIRGEIVSYDSTGKPGIQFTVNKFSTFTVVQLGSQAVHQAYMTGYPDGTFRPDKPITRAEMATVLVRLFGKDKGNKTAAKTYTDTTPGHWANAAIDLAADSGLMDGYPDGSFKPEQTITRAEAASIAARLSSAAEGSGSFSDTVGHWAAAAIGKAKAAGVVNGYGDGTFRPEQTLTRAEAVMMLNKLSGRDPLSVSDAKWSDVPSQHWAFKNIQEASVDHVHVPVSVGGK